MEPRPQIGEILAESILHGQKKLNMFDLSLGDKIDYYSFFLTLCTLLVIDFFIPKGMFWF